MTTVTGRVKNNPARQRSSAPFVIVDRNGEIQYFLRSAAGVNLNRFVNQEVQLRGTARTSNGRVQPTLDVQNLVPRRQVRNDRPPRDAAPPRSQSSLRGQPPMHGQPPARNMHAGRQRPLPPQESLVNEPHEHAHPVSHNEETPAAALESVESPMPQSVMKQPPRQLDPPGEAPYLDEDAGNLTFDEYGHDHGDESGYEPGGYCGTCGGPQIGGCCNVCGPPGRFWVRAEYLYWWTEGMYVPPLVTTGPSADQPGYLDTPGTTILFGDQRINGYGRSGARFTAGAWLDACQTVGIEGDYYFVGTANTNYFASSNGDPILSRPFFDLSPTQADPLQIVGQNVEQVALPGSIAGSVAVDAETRFQSAGVRMLWNLCCSTQCYNDDCFPMWNGPGGRRLDVLLGYRYARLSDSLAINEDLTSLQTEAPGTFLVNDTFQTQNVFNGAELGAVWTGYRGRWLAMLIGKLALGNVYETVSIRGSTTTTQNGTTTTDTGGLLAQSTNIGDYSRSQFAVMPELGTNIGFSLTPRLRVLLGYTFVYLSRVARPGDQIDLNVNSRLLPNDDRPPGGDMRHPQFVFQETDFWAQGINVGLDYRW